MKFDVTKPAENNEPETEWVALPSNIYVATCIGAKIAPSRYADDKTGEHKDELTLAWELDEPLKHPQSPAKEYKTRIYQSMAPFYGEGSRGPSKFKMLIDQLWSERLIPQEFYVADGEVADNQGDLVTIKRRLFVQNYPLTMGPNKGKPGNKVLEILPLNPDTPLVNAEPPAKPVPSRPIPQGNPAIGEFTESELRKMNADELTQLANQLGETAGGRFRRDYGSLKHEGLVRKVLEIQSELLVEDLF